MRHHLVGGRIIAGFACTGALIATGCATHDEPADDPADPRCATQAVALGTHPHAPAQMTPLGRTLADTRGFHGRLYFAYGDLELNTGPIVISSFDPATRTWQDHPIGYKDPTTGALRSSDVFATHVIERFMPIGDSLWAPAGQPDFRPFGSRAAPEYAIGSATHEWNEVDIAPDSIHVIDAIERAPNDILLTGSGLFHDRGTAPDGPILGGGYVWRSVGGGPFTQIFPTFGATANEDNVDRSGAPFAGAALDGVAYMFGASGVYTVDGVAPAMTCCYVPPLGQFLRPVAFAGNLVFADLGQLFEFDGTSVKNLDFRLFVSRRPKRPRSARSTASSTSAAPRATSTASSSRPGDRSGSRDVVGAADLEDLAVAEAQGRTREEQDDPRGYRERDRDRER